MKRRLVLGTAIAALALSMTPVHANDPVSDISNAPNRYAPQPAGTRQTLRFVFGPYSVTPGVDRNQVTVDLPLQTGFTTGVFPNLIDATDGLEFTEQEAHIHHAHWFRITTDSQYESYSQGLSWVFGTGEERTGGSLRHRESSAEGWKYGIFNDGLTPNALIFMIHNKTGAPLTGYITLDVEFTWGTRQEIQAATGQDIHPLRGVLTGTTQDAVSKVLNGNSKNGVLMREYTSGFSGTLIASASHMHPGGKWVYVVNLGPRADGKFVCGNTADAEAVTDLDADGIPGTTLFVSGKIDRVPEAWPYSEEYQMGGTQGGFRAPIHTGDVIKQYGVYDLDRSAIGTGGLPAALFRTNPLDESSPVSYTSKDGLSHAWYEAMSYTGLYSDTDNQPAITQVTDAGQCSAATFAPYRVPSNGFNVEGSDIRSTYATRPDWGILDDHCGVPGYAACETGSQPQYQAGPVVTEIHTANFQYVWGDQALSEGPLNFLPKLKLGSTVRLINEDITLGGVRHTFTSCPWPCNGRYVANYPLPDGRFDSGKLGNLDYVDGGVTGDDTLPTYNLVVDPNLFEAGQKYSFFCSIHPWMRGAFEVTA